MQLDTHAKLSHLSISLHWLVGIVMIALLTTGVIMEEFEIYALYPWHKSFGVLIFGFALFRVVWRIINGWPADAGDYNQIEKILARVVHWLLIIGTILMPVSGFMMSAMGGHGVALFGLELVASNPDPANPGQVIPLNADLAEIAHNMHELGGNILIFAVALHLIAALKHHFFDKYGTLRRMLGGRI